MNAVLFLVLAALTIGTALAVVTNRNPVYSALALVSTLAVGLDVTERTVRRTTRSTERASDPRSSSPATPQPRCGPWWR